MESPRPRPQPQRQIHLDFHTSEHIPQLAQDWDPEQFAAQLQQARVASIQVFARCWHGWMYYPSKRFPQAIHPGLGGRDLLGAQIEACHRHGIRAPIYLAMEMDRRMADLHPEWTRRLPDGRLGERGVFEPGFGPALCLNTPFVDYLEAQIDELFERYAVDGFWFDGASPQNCCCEHCLRDMVRQGLDPREESARRRFGLEVVERVQARISQRVSTRNPAATRFYNSGHIGPRHRREAVDFTHFEIESLPSGGWGYLHFPIAARLARTFGLPVVGMTGKFHTSWGDFHAFKNAAALEYECFQMIALGAACSVGDQLHPKAALCPQTYGLIGGVFQALEAVEPWCRESEPVVEAALLTPEILGQEPWDRLLPAAIIGAVRLLQECALQFDILPAVYETLDLSRYRLVILPDTIHLGPRLAACLQAFLDQGGCILSTGLSGRTHAEGPFALAAWGLKPAGAAAPTDFIPLHGPLGAGLAATEYVFYRGGHPVAAEAGTEVLLEHTAPYFDRTWQQFCSHQHAPSSGRILGPAVTQCGAVLHCVHPIFTIYREKAPRWCRELVRNAIRRLLGPACVEHNGPSNLSVNLHAQPSHHRWVLHLLLATPERRGRDLDVIEELGQWESLVVRVRVPRPVQSVRRVPEDETLPHTQAGEGIEFCLPHLRGRQILALEFTPDQPSHD